MRVVLALIVVLLFAAGGGAAALMLRPAAAAKDVVTAPEPLPEPDYVSLPREFIVPLVTDGRVRAHVVMTLGLHSQTLPREELLRREPVIRDRLLEALFQHVATGGFDARFTDAVHMNRLRARLNEAASAAVHPDQATVLVMSIDRRDR